MTRRIFSILLTLALCLTLLPTAALAEDTATHANHCVCGATHSAVGDHTTEGVLDGWTAVSSASNLPTESGHYYLTADVTTGSGEWAIPENTNIVLCLNGKTLTANNGRASAYDTIMIKGTLTITDCSAAGTGKITGNNDGTQNCKAIQVAATGTLNLYGGSITGINVGGGSGGGVHNRGTFNMYGGAITNNKAKKGGGVLNWGAPSTVAIFNMYGGTISGNTSTDTEFTDGNEIYNELDYRSGTGGKPGVMNAYGGTVAGTVMNLESTITTAAGYTGTTFNGTVTNSSGSTISGGNFNGTVANSGTISGGSFATTVTPAEGYCLSNTADENGCYAIAEHDASRTSAITTAPSYNREGVRTYYCANCGEAVATDSIRRLTPSSPAHDVDIKSGAGGSVSVNLDEAREGSIVTITAVPEKGNALESLTVTDEDGNELEVHSIGGNKYTFIMPGGEVTIRASFAGDVPVGFVDVPADKYFYDAVMWAVRSGITGGVDATHFAPYASCTRGQLVTFLWRAAGEPAAESGEGFADVKTGSAFYQAILWAAENEIVGGYDDGAFRPNAAVSRQQVAAILWRFAKAQGMDVSVGEDTNILSYNDAFDVSEYAIPALQWACGANVMGGNDGNLLPYSACTRAQIVTMLYRLLAE